MKYSKKRVMYLAPEVPALSATFVYNEIFHFQELICPVQIVSVHRPHSPANEKVQQRLGNSITHLYESSRGACLKSVLRRLFRHPLRFLRAFICLLKDMASLGVVSRTAAGIGYRFIYAALLAEEMERQEVDHVHVHFAHVPGDLAMYASLMTGIPFSLTGHANDLYERGWLLKQKVRRSAFFATISEFNRRALIGMGCDGEKIEIVRCGIDQTDFQYRGEQRSTNEQLRIGSLGRLVPKKGFHTLLESCASLKEQGIDYVLEIAGDGPLLDALQSQADSLDLGGQVKFMGALPHNQVSEWMKSLDVFALACCEDENGDVDGIPVVLMEAMAIGVPVITTDVSGLPELVKHGETGLVGQPEAAAGIVELLRQISSSDDLREELAKKAKAHVDQEFTIQANVEKLGELIFSKQKL